MSNVSVEVRTMQYLCLGYYDVEKFDQLSEEDSRAIGKECAPHDARLHASGKLVSVASLAHRVAATLRPSKHGPKIVDGPYSEAKEVVGSIFIIEAEDLEEAKRIAALHPAAQCGEHLGFAIEVRPIERFQQVR